MSDDRRRQKQGHHTSVSGDPADQTLTDLIGQFSDPTAFVRELIQNSLDASASTIEVKLAYRESRLVVEVVDDGEGMDRPTIEGYLLTLFRSTKEDDLTKIGKFGIGFVSLFAMGPERVVVDTGRDAVWHRVEFDDHQNYTLLEMADPFEGTTVRLEIRCRKHDAKDLCDRIRDSAIRWCGFAEASITTEARGISGGWEPTSIARPFTIEAPITASARGDGFEAVVGVAREPVVGFYNHGLTLYEARAPLIPGVSFRVKGRHLEHTLTRDNVRRDRHFDAVIGRVRDLVDGALSQALHAELAEADATRAAELFAAIAHDHAWRWERRAPLFPRVGGGHASLSDLQGAAPGWLRTLWGGSRELLWAQPADPVGAAVEADGGLVLAAQSESAAHLVYAAELVGATLTEARQRFMAPRRPDPSAERDERFAAATALARRLGIDIEVLPALDTGRFALTQQEPYALQAVRADGLELGRAVLIDVEHPLVAALTALPADHAAPLLLRAAFIGVGRAAEPIADAWLEGLR